MYQLAEDWKSLWNEGKENSTGYPSLHKEINLNRLHDNWNLNTPQVSGVSGSQELISGWVMASDVTTKPSYLLVLPACLHILKSSVTNPCE